MNRLGAHVESRAQYAEERQNNGFAHHHLFLPISLPPWTEGAIGVAHVQREFVQAVAPSAQHSAGQPRASTSGSPHVHSDAGRQWLVIGSAVHAEERLIITPAIAQLRNVA